MAPIPWNTWATLPAHWASFSMCSNPSRREQNFKLTERYGRNCRWTPPIPILRLRYLKTRCVRRQILASILTLPETPYSAAPSIQEPCFSTTWEHDGAQTEAEASWGDDRIPILSTTSSTTLPATPASISADGTRSRRESRHTQMSGTHLTLTT